MTTYELDQLISRCANLSEPVRSSVRPDREKPTHRRTYLFKRAFSDMSDSDIEISGTLEVNDEMEVCAPDWFDPSSDWLVVTPNSTHDSPGDELTNLGNSEIKTMGPFPISLEEWSGVGLASPDREHLMRASNEIKESLVPDKILIEVDGERRFYRIPREDPLE